MKKILITLSFIPLYGCGILPDNLQQSNQSEVCPEQPDIALDAKNVQEIALGNGRITASGRVNKGQSVAYTFTAEEGQKLTYNTDNDICIWVFTPENDLLPSISLPKKGKYIIQIASLSDSTNFELAMALDTVQESNNNNNDVNQVTVEINAPPISQEQAVELVTKWQKSKPRIFAPPYDRNLGAELLTGKAYRDRIKRTDGTESSIDWLSNNNSYYTYTSQSFDSVKNFTSSDSQATIDVVMSEQRTFCQNSQASSNGNTAEDQRVISYILQPEQGTWKIAEYKTIETISSSDNPEPTCQISN
ncbi:MAG: DUF4101 domain-containing protein [Symploca sp. SIO1B1]|nr:DUF4101 domain-containing protein [Symploca sp. SIO1B1]